MQWKLVTLKIFSPRISYIFWQCMQWMAVNYLFLLHSTEFLQSTNFRTGFDPLNNCMSTTSYFTPPSVTYFYDISCKFKEDSVNFGKKWVDFLWEMRWISRWIFVRIRVKCIELFFHRIRLISHISLPQKRMRWTFARKAVNFAVNFVRNAVNAVNSCRKWVDYGECGEKKFNAFHCISYKNSSHSICVKLM